MTDDQRDEEAEAPADSVFGSLPRERPGTRSPRRGAEARDRAARADSPRAGPPSRDEGETQGAEIQGVEDLAWAGVAIAAEAATLGVRLAGRAIDALRGPGERS